MLRENLASHFQALQDHRVFQVVKVSKDPRVIPVSLETLAHQDGLV